MVEMNKVKIALTLLTIAIIVGPFAYVVIAYSDNLIGLVVPPQFSNLSQSLGQNLSGQNLSSSSNNPINLTGTNFQMPQVIGTPQYNPDTGAFNAAINVTNPLSNPISVDQASVPDPIKTGHRHSWQYFYTSTNQYPTRSKCNN